MVRLAHLSDIHITAAKLEWTRTDWFNKRLAAWINFRWFGRARRFRYADHVLTRLVTDIQERCFDRVVLSGDATALGFEAEFRRAAELLQVNTLSGLAVPGNHDYCTVPAEASGLFEASFAPWLAGQRVDGDKYPFAQRVGPAWLIGVNTARGNRLAWNAAGAAGPAQRERLARLLAELEPGPRILVTHYPVCLASGKREHFTHGLLDMPELVDVAVKGGVSLWLHGHRHGFYHFQKPPLAPFPIICGGSSTQNHLWSYGDYTLDGHSLAVVRREYDFATDRIVETKRFTLNLPMDIH